MDKSELTSRDIENIGKWEQSFKKLNRKTYTVKEASAFIIGWHPGAYLNDHRKNQIPFAFDIGNEGKAPQTIRFKKTK